MRLVVTCDAVAPTATAWTVLTAWERQPDWMLDARAVEVLTPRRVGTGVVIRCPTSLFGITVQDVMRVTAWDAPRLLEVVHLGGLIRGRGLFELAAVDAGRTRITWTEDVVVPFGRLGELGASKLALPALRRLFDRSLHNLAMLAEREAMADERATPSSRDGVTDPRGP